MEMNKGLPREKLRFFGRTIEDSKTDTIFFNWSGSGFELAFSGTALTLRLEGTTNYFPTEGTNYPWIAILLDGETEPIKLIRVSEGTADYPVFQSTEPQTHTLKIVKRSEAIKGRVGLKGLAVAGELLALPKQPDRPRLEFIGDSITCGFGNETAADGSFSTATENGLLAYGAIAANLLGAAYNSICVSGIPLCAALDKGTRLTLPELPDFELPQRAMEDYYAYTDRNHQEEAGGSVFEDWDFDRFRPDAIIINLGTNDAYRLKATGHKPDEERHFETQYKRFLYRLRQLNGKKPLIVCTLGAMDYYLYDNILRAVSAFREETGDDRVCCFKFGAIFVPEEGIGALDHPSIKTHRRMGWELAKLLAQTLKLTLTQGETDDGCA